MFPTCRKNARWEHPMQTFVLFSNCNFYPSFLEGNHAADAEEQEDEEGDGAGA